MKIGNEPDPESQKFVSSHRCISQCCAAQVPVTLISPDSGIVSKGVFHKLEAGRITVRLSPGNYPLLSDQMCCATFDLKNRRSYFFASIIGVQETLDRELVLAMPQQISAEKRRPAMRIKVPKESGFGVSLHHNDHDYLGEIININVHGALIDFADTLDVKLETRLQLELSLRGRKALVPACPVRREGSRLGFAFEGSNDADWKAELQQMLKQIDRDWISKQSRIDNIPRPYVDLSLREPTIRAAT